MCRSSNRHDRRQVLVSLTPLLHRQAHELMATGQQVAAVLERRTVDELALLCDFVCCDRELNERRARRLAERERATTRRSTAARRKAPTRAAPVGGR
jgi:DNA-binding MarR family transcriptional regulator